MKSQKKKPFAKVAIAIISAFGITAIGVSSALAGANKEFQDTDDSVICVKYDKDRQPINRIKVSSYYCDILVNQGTSSDGSYWWY